MQVYVVDSLSGSFYHLRFLCRFANKSFPFFSLVIFRPGATRVYSGSTRVYPGVTRVYSGVTGQYSGIAGIGPVLFLSSRRIGHLGGRHVEDYKRCALRLGTQGQ